MFFSIRPSPRRLPNSTGITAELDLAGTLALASKLPDLRHVFVVSGAGTTNSINERVAREQFRQFEPRLEIT